MSYFTILNNLGFYAGQWKDGQRHGFGMRADADISQFLDSSTSLHHLFVENPTLSTIAKATANFGGPVLETFDENAENDLVHKHEAEQELSDLSKGPYIARYIVFFNVFLPCFLKKNETKKREKVCLTEK